MSRGSRFFNAMTCFFSNDQSGKQSKKKSSVQKNKFKKKHDVLAVDQVSQTTSKPKRHLQSNTAKPKVIAETVDLTKDEDDVILPMEIQIHDEHNNIGPFVIHIKTDPDISINCFTNQVSGPEKFIKSEQTANDNAVILLKDEHTTNDSILIDGMSVEKQNEPLKRDAPLLNQYDVNDCFNLSRNENKKISRENNQTDETEIKSVKHLPKGKCKIDRNSTAVDSSKKNAEKANKNRKKYEWYLDSELITLKESGAYYCSLCDVSFKGKRMVGTHVKSHNMVKFKYRCSVCMERFYWKRYLIRHLKEHFVTSDLEQTIEPEQTKSELISKSEPKPVSLLSKTIVDDHETFNNLEKKLKSNSNATHASLIKVINDTDRIELNLACAYCDQCFDSQISLVEHCRTHMTDRPFICNVCGTLFKQNAALLYHTRTHFRMMRSRKRKISAPYIKYVLRLHSCKDCDRSYVSWPALNQHRVDIHGAIEDSFVCDVCQRSFITLGRLRVHKDKKICKNRDLPKQRLNCGMCAKSFCNKYILKKHMLKRHPKN